MARRCIGTASQEIILVTFLGRPDRAIVQLCGNGHRSHATISGASTGAAGAVNSNSEKFLQLLRSLLHRPRTSAGAHGHSRSYEWTYSERPGSSGSCDWIRITQRQVYLLQE